jgi:hypothetical protein
MEQGEKGDGVLGPAVPAALLDAYWLKADSPARSGCQWCGPGQATHCTSPGAEKDVAAGGEVPEVLHVPRRDVSRAGWVARTLILALAAASIVASICAAAVTGD